MKSTKGNGERRGKPAGFTEEEHAAMREHVREQRADKNDESAVLAKISNRFDDTVAVLTKALGSSSRVLVHRTVIEMFRQYSQRADFSYQDSLRERLIVLREAVLAQHLVPKIMREGFDFDNVAVAAKRDSSGGHQKIYG